MADSTSRTAAQGAAARARRGARSLLPALLLLAVSFLGSVFLASRPGPTGSQVAVIFPPGTSADQAILAVAAADGEIVREGAWPGLIVARSDDPAFPARLHAQGALAVLNPVILGSCAAP
jgi:hypothetical protein